MILQCKSVVFKLNDMQDWQAIQLGNFRRRNICFDFQKIVKDTFTFMKSKTSLRMNLYAEFDNNLNFGDNVPI